MDKHVKRKKKLKDWFKEYKNTLKCKNCKENHPSCLEFHHIGDDKEHHVGRMPNEGYSVKRILEEIEKCEVLCANCHRKKHW